MTSSSAAQGRSRQLAPWRAIPIAATLTVTVALLGFIATAQWSWGIHQAVLGGEAIAPSDAGGGGLTEYFASASIAYGLLMVAGLTPWRAGFGVQLATGEDRVLRTLRATAFYAAALVVIGVASAWVTTHTGTAVASVGEVYGTFDWSTRLASSARAGIWEETVNVAAPIGIAFVGVWISRLARSGDIHDIDDRTVPVWCYAAGLFGLVTRLTDHMYQGPIAAVFVVFAGMVAVGVFARYGSIVPLILGHFVFDAFVAGRTFLPAGSLGGVLLDGGVVAVVVAATFVPAIVAQRRVLA